MPGLSSLTRDQTRTPCSGDSWSQPLDPPGESLQLFINHNSCLPGSDYKEYIWAPSIHHFSFVFSKSPTKNIFGPPLSITFCLSSVRALLAGCGQCSERLSDGDLVFSSASEDQEAWQRGVLFASGQNLARRLMETPANEMTPTKFAEIVEENLKSASIKTDVFIR